MRMEGASRAQATAVLLVAHGNDGDTLACLASLAALRVVPGWIVVADNSGEASLFGAWQALWQEKGLPAPVMAESAGANDAFLYLPLPENRGFAAGINAALARVRGRAEWFWILNPDTVVDPYALEALLDAAESDPGIGVAGSTLILPPEPPVLQAAGGSTLNPLYGKTRHLLAGSTPEQALNCDAHAVNRRLDDIIGASMLVRAGVVEKAGLMDEDFFLYCEETEWCVRIRRAGYRFVWAGESRVLHKEGGSSGAHGLRRPAWVDYLMLRNRILLLRRHYPASLPLAALSYGVVALKRLFRGQPRRIPLVWRALWDGLRGKDGRPEMRALERYENAIPAGCAAAGRQTGLEARQE
jgi:GT2 family glycosyltransferase